MKESERTKIIDELAYLEYDFTLKGTQYLLATIEYIINNNYNEIYNLEKDIYSKISSIYNTSVHNIKININRANNNMYFKCEIEKLKKYFRFVTDEKPKTKLIINTVIANINLDKTKNVYIKKGG